MNICGRLILVCLTLGGGLAHAAVNPQLPVAFISNQGQADPAVKYIGTGPRFHALFYDRKVIVRQGRVQLQVQFKKSLPSASLAAAKPIGAAANYISGNDPAGWKTGIPMQGEMSYHGLWPGIDLRYEGTATQLKAEYLVAPAADVNNIRVSYDGQVGIQPDGSLLVRGAGGEYRENRPYLYQQIGAVKREIRGGFRMIDNATIGFWTADYDHAKELIIDPVITYSTLFGGSSQDDITGVGYDANLNTYIAGYTSSSDLPLVNAVKPRGGSVDAFVAKYSVGTGKLLYCTFLGGSGDDRVFGLAVDSAGDAFITGWTTSTNFPTVHPMQAHLAGTKDAFVTKLNPTGSAIVYSTYFGGNGSTAGNAIAIDIAGEAAITGDTTSMNLPATATFQTTLKGGQDAFLLKLQASGASSVVSYFGGANVDHGASIAMDSAGNMVLGGSTYSTDIPLQSAYQSANGGGETGFVALIPANAAYLYFSTYLGGANGSATHPEGVNSVAFDYTSSVPSVYVAGITSSSNFPITAGAYQTIFGGGSDGFVSRFSTTGGLLASTFFGGTALDGANGLALDFYGNPHIAGFTNSIDFPIARAPQSLNHGSRDAFVAKLDKNLDKVLYSTYLGGLGTDAANAIAVDSMCTVLVAGQTGSTDFPVVKAAQSTKIEPLGGFMTKVAPGWTVSLFYYGLWFVDATHSRGSDGSSYTGAVYSFGQTGDLPIAGDWDGSGKRKIGIFRNGTWIIDSNGNGQIDASDRTFTFGQAGDIPVVGDWDGTGHIKAGLFRAGSFILDYSGHLSGIATGKADVTFNFGHAGDIPIAGDWNGAGTTKVGTFKNGQWTVDYTGDHVSTRAYTFGTTGDIPIVGDWDGSGAAKIGIFRNPAWCFDYDGDNLLTAPGFTELLFWFGINGASPVVL